MKKITLSAAVLLLFMMACKTGQKTTDTAAKKETTNTVASAEPALSADLAAAADKRYPFAAKADIAEGQKLYTGKCGRCHGLPEVESISEDKWPGIMDWMAPKANMDEKQKTQVLNYVLCAADVKKMGK